ncbi:methyltransferase family protein [Streptomyces sp. BK022]|nr:methyltransferase family protein [Streptomyces sp. BK022]
MLAQASPWHAHALQRTAAGLAEPLAVPARMEWTTRPGQGPGADVLGPDLRGKRLLELGCGPGHNAAHLATRHGAHVTGVDLVGLQVRRARSHYGRLNNLTFIASHALHYLHATDEQFDAIYSVFGAVGLVAPELLLPAIAQRLTPGRVLAFSVPHPQRGGRSPADDDRPCPTAPGSPSPAGSSTPTAGRSTSAWPASGSPRPRSSTTPAWATGPPPC